MPIPLAYSTLNPVLSYQLFKGFVIARAADFDTVGVVGS
jgi:hypothetical protein